jgi:uncharacterized membrane protein
LAATAIMNTTIPLPVSCPDCEARMPETAVFCPGCGRRIPAALEVEEPAKEKVGLLAENIVGALAYLTFIPAIVFLLREPYRGNRFVRFHSVQSLLLWAMGALAALALKVASMLLFVIPFVGPLFTVLVLVIVGLGAVAIWMVLVVKALQGEMFKLPVLGEYAEQQANSPQA